MPKAGIFVVTFAALFFLSPVPVRSWVLRGEAVQSVSFPFSNQEVLPDIEQDLDGDGKMETLELLDGKLQIKTGAEVQWESPDEWDVYHAELSDLNHDGVTEAVLLVWRPFKPWPVDKWLPSGGRIERFHNAAGNSCHIILIGWHRGEFTERWAGSALADPVTAFATADLNQDGYDEMATLETTYAVPPGFPAESLKIWEWNGFGFSLVSEVYGTFTELKVFQTVDDRIVLVTP